MDIGDFKVNDVVRITIYDTFSGDARVKIVDSERLIADWIWVGTCYGCQRYEEQSVEITKADFEMGLVAELKLLDRKDCGG